MVGISIALLGLGLFLFAIMRLAPNWKQSSMTDWMLVILTGLYVLVTTAQLSALHGQWTQMLESNKTARDAMTLAQRQFESSQSSSAEQRDAVKESNASAAKLAASSEQFAAAAQKNAEAAIESNRLTVKALDEAEKWNIRTNRPWMVPAAAKEQPEGVPSDVELIAETLHELPVDIENTGKSPAHKVLALYGSFMTPLTLERQPSAGAAIEKRIEAELNAVSASGRFHETGLIGPGHRMTLFVPGKFPQADIDRFRNGRLGILAFGRITYVDTFVPDKRVTKFCFVLVRNDPRMTVCNFHNSAD